MALKDKRVGFLGSGNMGEALIKGLVAAHAVEARAIHATDVREEHVRDIAKRYGITVAPDNTTLVRETDVIVLAVKPQNVDAVLRGVAASVTREKLLISIAAGVSTARL